VNHWRIAPVPIFSNAYFAWRFGNSEKQRNRPHRQRQPAQNYGRNLEDTANTISAEDIRIDH
jgi:hypothetical protein